MFTGIVQITSPIDSIADNGDGSLRRIAISPQWRDKGNDVRLGDSIAVNGVCLTAADIVGDTILFDVIAETLAKTNLGLLKVNDRVNLERSLRVGDRIDGHFVQGHVDGVALVRAVQIDSDDVRISADAPPHLAKYLVPKGSVCLDGVSLTIAKVEGARFEVALIPTTLSLTTLRTVKADSILNLEADTMTKTIVATLERMRIPIQD